MKPQSLFLVSHKDPDELLKAVQEACQTEAVQAAIKEGEWEFTLKRHKVTGCECVYMYGEWSVIYKLYDHINPVAREIERRLPDYEHRKFRH